MALNMVFLCQGDDSPHQALHMQEHSCQVVRHPQTGLLGFQDGPIIILKICNIQLNRCFLLPGSGAEENVQCVYERRGSLSSIVFLSYTFFYGFSFFNIVLSRCYMPGKRDNAAVSCWKCIKALRKKKNCQINFKK